MFHQVCLRCVPEVEIQNKKKMVSSPCSLRTLSTRGSSSRPAWSSSPSFRPSSGRWCWTRCCCWRSGRTRRWRPRAAKSGRPPIWSAGSEATWRWGSTVRPEVHRRVERIKTTKHFARLDHRVTPGFVGGCRAVSGIVSFKLGWCVCCRADVPLRQVVGEECVAFMLNWRENDYLTLQVPPSLVMNNPYIKVKTIIKICSVLSNNHVIADRSQIWGCYSSYQRWLLEAKSHQIRASASLRQLGQLLASTCKELPGPKESRRTAKELWEVVVQICSVSIQHKRNSDGRVGLIKHRESSMGILYRCAAATAAVENLRPNGSCCSFRYFFFSMSHPLRSKFITFIKKLRVSAPRRSLYFNLGWNHFPLADMFLSSLLPHLTGTPGADDPHFTVREAPQHRAGTIHTDTTEADTLLALCKELKRRMNE